MATEILQQTVIDPKSFQQLAEDIRQATLEILNKSKFKQILEKHNIPEEDLTIKVCAINSRELEQDSFTVKYQEIQNLAKKLQQPGTDTTKSQQLVEDINQASLEMLSTSKFKNILKKYNIPEEKLTIRISTINSPELKQDSFAVKHQKFLNTPVTIENTPNQIIVADSCTICGMYNGDYICIPCTCPC